jgi:signal transduction histidine kinase
MEVVGQGAGQRSAQKIAPDVRVERIAEKPLRGVTGSAVLSRFSALHDQYVYVPAVRSFRRSALARLGRLKKLGISARSAAVSAIVVSVALALAGSVLGVVLYRFLLAGVDDATAGRVRSIVGALHTNSPDDLDSALLTTNQRVIAIQLVGPNGDVVKGVGAAPATPLVPVNRFDSNLLRGMSDDAVADDDMRVSGQKVNTAHGEYTVIVGGGSEAVEATARTVVLLFACGAPVIVWVAAAASYRLVRRSLHSVDAIRSRVAEISASDLAERVPVPGSHDEISALAVTMNEMLARIEAGHRAQQRFVGDASHELRSPLSTIISGLEAAEDHPELLNTGLASKILLPEAHRMRTLINDLLLLARADEQRLVMRTEEVSVNEVAEAEVARAQQDASCAIHTVSTPVRIVGDSTAISRVIRNLLDNAVRHATSRVDVCVGSRDRKAIIAIGDDGPGIAPEDRTRVFERFVRLDSDRSRSSGGAGLGLAIVAEVVAAHGGTVTIADQPGRGTTMLVSLPQHTNR